MKKREHLFTSAAFILAYSFLRSPAQNGPPKETSKLEGRLDELNKLSNTMKLDIRYATANNLSGVRLHGGSGILQRPAAEHSSESTRNSRNKALADSFDGYRPWSVTKLFWEVVPEDKTEIRQPAQGLETQPRLAVDLSIYDLNTGQLIDMPSGFDEFTDRASPDYIGGRKRTGKSRHAPPRMEAEGFTVNPKNGGTSTIRIGRSTRSSTLLFQKLGGTHK
jgi:D-alanyl-D-alanine dipeptidase